MFDTIGPPSAASPLVAAAQAFDEALQQFGRLAGLARANPLDSPQDFERAAQTASEIAESERVLSQRAGALIEALGAARDEQESHARTINEHVEAFERRSNALHELTQRYSSLGHDAAMLNQRVQGLAIEPCDGSFESTAKLVDALRTINAEMLAAGERAHALAADAREAGFADLHAQASSLREQLASAREKFVQLEHSLARGSSRGLA